MFKQNSDSKYIKYKPSQQNAAFNSGSMERVIRMVEMHADPFDKRLVADGRGLQEVHINDNFAKVSEALYVTEQMAREAVAMRSKVQKEILSKEKERKEQELRALAQKARSERIGVAPLVASEKERRLYDKDAGMGKKCKITRDKDRDISEKVALGMAYTKQGIEVMYDERLSNQDKGMSSGFGYYSI